MRSSTSRSSAEPTVSVVIGSNAPPGRLAACLDALEPQLDGVEVLVREGDPSPAELRERFPWADFGNSPGRLVPEHWRDGIDAASGDIIALTIAQMIPVSGWIARIRDLHREQDAVGGAIEPGPGMRLVDWAEYFCRYSPDMLPFDAHQTVDLPGDNAAYKRSLLESISETYRDGFWEPVSHRRLAADGVVLWHDPSLVVRQGRSAGFTAFVRQRIVHGRRHGHQRGVHFSTARNLAGVFGAPLVPALMTLRVLRRVFGKRRHRLRAVAALPTILAYNTAWAIGEARGHVDILRGR